jgi:hypothetical protein
MIGIEPMLATAAAVLPAGQGWLFEPKYDGVRVLAHGHAGGVALVSRRGNSLTNQFPDVVEPLGALRSAVGRDFLLDGEIVSTTSDDFAGFQVLQSRLAVEKPFQIRMLALRIPAAFVGFDLLSVGGRALLDRPLAERRQVLEALLSAPPSGIRLAEQSEDGPVLLARSLAERWEGLVAKRADSRYLPGQRAATWLKIKAVRRQEFVVAVHGVRIGAARVGRARPRLPRRARRTRLRGIGRLRLHAPGAGRRAPAPPPPGVPAVRLRRAARPGRSGALDGAPPRGRGALRRLDRGRPSPVARLHRFPPGQGAARRGPRALIRPALQPTHP